MNRNSNNTSPYKRVNSINKETEDGFDHLKSDAIGEFTKMNSDAKEDVIKKFLKKEFKDKPKSKSKFVEVSESNKLLNFNINEILKQISLYKTAEGIWCVKILDDWLRAMIFLRYQEFYESISDDFRGKDWEIQKYIDWYKNKYKKDNIFTYGYDWAGYNIPSSSVYKCISGIKDRNWYDEIMSCIIDEIEKEDSKNWYIIGVDVIDADVLQHEMAHGLWATHPEYRRDMERLVSKLNGDVLEILYDKLSEIGYTPSVYHDEIQAYLSTGLTKSLQEIEKIDETCVEFKELFMKWFNKLKYEPQEVKINWSSRIDKNMLKD
jgi:hypothetical protein